MRNTRVIATALVLFACTFSNRTSAQNATTAAAACSGDDRVVVADLGFSFECTCVFRPHSPGGPAWDFRSEPRITEVGRRGPARGALQDGDILVAIDGKLITTREGGQRFARALANEPVVLTVRRAGRQMTVKLFAQQSCLDESIPPVAATPQRALPAVPAQPAITPRAPAPPPAVPATLPTPPQPPTPPYAPAPPPGYPDRFPLAWFGFGLSCGDCGFLATPKPGKIKGALPEWKFTTPPEIYSVDAGGPADRAGLKRGDILTDIDGMSLTTATGSRKFSDVVPGQRVQFGYRRGAERHNVVLVAQARPEYQERSYAYTTPPRARTAPMARTAQRLRYSGSIAGADVEVRGVGSVVVNSSGDEIIITTGDTTVRIRANAKKQ